jgi:hypothetical protein
MQLMANGNARLNLQLFGAREEAVWIPQRRVAQTTFSSLGLALNNFTRRT